MINGRLFLSLELVYNRLAVLLLTFEWYLHEIYVHCRISLSEINFTTIKAVLHEVRYYLESDLMEFRCFSTERLLRKKIGEFWMLMSTTNFVAFTTRKSSKLSHLSHQYACLVQPAYVDPKFVSTTQQPQQAMRVQKEELINNSRSADFSDEARNFLVCHKK